MLIRFLLNDFDIIADEEEIFQVLMDLAAGKVSSAQLSAWLKLKTKKIK